jgi:hypothetical protein
LRICRFQGTHQVGSVQVTGSLTNNQIILHDS